MKRKRSPYLNRYGRRSEVASRIVVVMIVVLITVIAVFVGLGIYNMPEKRATREVEHLAREYYENHLYGEFVNSFQGKTLEEMFEPYKENGFNPVYLRQLILFDEAAHPEAAEVFDNKQYKCDTNTSKVRFYPQAPYGKTDYKVTFEMSCKEK